MNDEDPIFDEDEPDDCEAYCPMCGAEYGQECAIECPNNDSPFALLIREGYD